MASHSNVSYARIDNCLMMEGLRKGIVKQTFTAGVTALTIALADPPVHFYTPGAAMTIKLPTATKGLEFSFYNRSTTTANTLTIQDPTGPTTVSTIASVSQARYISDGTSWYVAA